MKAYTILIEILLLSVFIYEWYMYYAFKYKSVLVSGAVKKIENYEVFQRPSTKVLAGEKRALKVHFEYTLNGNVYKKMDRIAMDKIKGDIEKSIDIYVLKDDPKRCSIKPHSVRRIRLVIAAIALILWSVATYFMMLI